MRIESGVPYDSILDLFLYFLYTLDFLIRKQTTTVTFADDTAIMASHVNSKIVSENSKSNTSTLKPGELKLTNKNQYM